MRGCRAGLKKSFGRKPLVQGRLRPHFRFLPVTSRFITEGANGDGQPAESRKEPTEGP